MWELFRTVAKSAVSALGSRRELALENLALRHQLTVLNYAHLAGEGAELIRLSLID